MSNPLGMVDKKNTVSKLDLINWVNGLLKLNITKIEQCNTGAIYCQLLDVICPGKVKMSKVNWKAYLEIDFHQNFKVFEQGLADAQIKKNIDCNKLAKGRLPDHMDLLQFLKNYYEEHPPKDAYDAKKKRGNQDLTYGSGNMMPRGNKRKSPKSISIPKNEPNKVKKPRQPSKDVSQSRSKSSHSTNAKGALKNKTFKAPGANKPKPTFKPGNKTNKVAEDKKKPHFVSNIKTIKEDVLAENMASNTKSKMMSPMPQNNLSDSQAIAPQQPDQNMGSSNLNIFQNQDPSISQVDQVQPMNDQSQASMDQSSQNDVTSSQNLMFSQVSQGPFDQPSQNDLTSQQNDQPIFQSNQVDSQNDQFANQNQFNSQMNVQNDSQNMQLSPHNQQKVGRNRYHHVVQQKLLL